MLAPDENDSLAPQSTSNRKVDAAEDERRTWFLEIRFPKWCKYPRDPPLILLRSLIPDIPKSICLRINQRLIDETRELAKDEIPSIFSVINVLRSEEDILSFLKKAESYLTYPPSDISIFDYDPLSGGVKKSHRGKNGDEELPTHHVMGRVEKFDKKSLSGVEILRENQKLMRKFHDTKQTKQYQEMLKIRQSLPAWPVRDEIVGTIKDNQVCIISGETGSGKSTQTPQMILDDWLESGKMDRKCEIVVTQPRRIATLGVAERICDERCTRIGGIVGYQIRLENQVSVSTRLTFCTTGILLRRLYSGEFFCVVVIVMDEGLFEVKKVMI
jgi:ATP-dependent RNA helicase DHX57